MPPLMPAAFLGHGTPMNALADNRYTRAWQAFGQRFSAPAGATEGATGGATGGATEQAPRPRAILVVSAHWYTRASAVLAMAKPETVHDFYGFPDELFAVTYPAPGDPELAAEVADLLEPTPIALDHESWGFDHGTWSLLVHAFPEADIPVVQLSIDATKGFEYHLELGARLAPLRERGVLVIASGDIAHNLRLADRSQQLLGFDWAVRFDDAARELLLTDPGAILRLRSHADFGIAVPTPDHFIPSLYLAGLAQAAGETPEVIVDGYQFASVSMTSYLLSG